MTKLTKSERIKALTQAASQLRKSIKPIQTSLRAIENEIKKLNRQE